MVRELGLRIINAVLRAAVQAGGRDARDDISVRDVNQARTAMGMNSDETVHDETILLSCPSVKELVKRAKQPAGEDAEREDQRLMDANRARDLLQKWLLWATADVLRGIQISQGGTGERGDAVQKRLAALYESQHWRELDTCLFLPRTKFGSLLPAVFHSIAAHFPRFTPGGKIIVTAHCRGRAAVCH